MTSLISYYEPLNGNVCEVKPKLSVVSALPIKQMNASRVIVLQIRFYAAYPGGSAV
jgi:hypothetical protein